MQEAEHLTIVLGSQPPRRIVLKIIKNLDQFDLNLLSGTIHFFGRLCDRPIIDIVGTINYQMLI